MLLISITFWPWGSQPRIIFLPTSWSGTCWSSLIVVGCLYLLARLAAEAVRPWLRRQLARHPLMEHSLPHLTKMVTARLLSPIFAVVFLWFALRIASHFHWPNHGIRIFLSLFLAWVIIRLLTSQMKNRTLARFISVIIWSIAALDIVHVLIPVLDLAQQHRPDRR